MVDLSLKLSHQSGPGNITCQICVKKLFHRVVTAAGKGVTTKNTTKGNPYTFSGPIA